MRNFAPEIPGKVDSEPKAAELRAGASANKSPAAPIKPPVAAPMVSSSARMLLKLHHPALDEGGSA